MTSGGHKGLSIDPASSISLQLLRLNQQTLSNLIIQSDQVDPIVTILVDLLVRCTREKDSFVAGLAGKGLGLIGAVDPGKSP